MGNDLPGLCSSNRSWVKANPGVNFAGIELESSNPSLEIGCSPIVLSEGHQEKARFSLGITSGKSPLLLELQGRINIKPAMLYGRFNWQADPVTGTTRTAEFVATGNNWIIYTNAVWKNTLEGKFTQTYNFTLYWSTTAYTSANLKGRLGAANTFTPGGEKPHNLSAELKIEGTFRNKPWSGWGIQLFLPIAVEDRPIGFIGTYLWTGFSLPRSYFMEIGAWLGKEAFDRTAPFDRSLAAGFGFSIKTGQDPRFYK